MFSILSRLSIRVLAPLLFGIPVLVVGVWLSLTWNHQSQTAVTELAEQGIDEIHRNTSTKIADVLSIPARICQLNDFLIRADDLPTSDLPAWRPTLVQEAKAFGMLSSISWGSADGRSVWVSRYGNGHTYWAEKNDPSATTMVEWQLNNQGEVLVDSRNSFEFRLETRPWFQTPQNAQQATWSEPYVWVGGGTSTEKTLGISYGIPLYNRDRELMGVIAADYSLNDISKYLGQLEIGESGIAVLLSRDGRLLAASDQTPIISDAGVRMPSIESSNPLVAAAGEKLEDVTLYGNVNYQLKQAGEVYLLDVSEVGSEVGLDWILVTIVPKQDFLGTIDDEFFRSWLTSLIAVVLAVGLGLGAAGWLVQPISCIVAGVRRIGKGDFDSKLQIDHAPEYTSMAEEINKMASDLKDRMRMQKSLSLAMEVQRNLLPTDPPQIKGLDIAGHSTYCDETGGDYYDFLDVTGTDEDTAVLVVGDVMGHGVAAALLMATARGILRSRCANAGSLADFLNHLNEMLVEDTQGERFMTMLMVTLSAKKDSLRWVSAGHGPPIIFDPATNSFPELDGGGLPLGLMTGQRYAEYWHSGIQKGSVVMATTDGLIETMNEQSEQFGKERLQQLLRENADKSAQEISDVIVDQIVQYRGSGSQDDDLTFVIAKVL